MQYFKMLTVPDPDELEVIKSRLKLIEKTFSDHLTTMLKGLRKISVKVIQYLLNDKILSSGEFPKLPDDIKNKQDSAHMAFGYLRKIYVKIRKLESAVKKAMENNLSELIKAYLLSLKLLHYQLRIR
jgi:hypothetical protein